MEDKDLKLMLTFLLGAAIGTAKDKVLIGFLIGASVGIAAGFLLSENKEDIEEKLKDVIDKIKEEYKKYFPEAVESTDNASEA